jgi:glycyl-tRNA synthetase
LGADRVMLAFLLNAYEEEQLEDGTERIVLRLHPALSAFKAAVFPLTKKLSEPATALFNELSEYINVDYDEAGSIGKRYRRHDEIGTPFCITYDYDSLEDKCVTVRFRDTMEQKRIKIDELTQFIQGHLKF